MVNPRIIFQILTFGLTAVKDAYLLALAKSQQTGLFYEIESRSVHVWQNKIKDLLEGKPPEQFVRMTRDEAQKVLGLKTTSSKEILERANSLSLANDKIGSMYIKLKIDNAKQILLEKK